MFKIIKRFKENGIEKTSDLGYGDETTLTMLKSVCGNHSKYAGVTFEKEEVEKPVEEKKESRKDNRK